MNPDDDVCLCFHVPLRKIRSFLARENPPVASLISECLSAGTGCQWCVPFLKHLHQCHVNGRPVDLAVSPEEYAKSRAAYRLSNARDPATVRKATASDADDGGPAPVPSP